MILYTNHIHCAVDSGIGYAGLASLQSQYEADGNTVLLVDCGDAIQDEPIGTLSEGEYIIDIMNAVGYDVAAIDSAKKKVQTMLLPCAIWAQKNPSPPGQAPLLFRTLRESMCSWMTTPLRYCL